MGPSNIVENIGDLGFKRMRTPRSRQSVTRQRETWRWITSWAAEDLSCVSRFSAPPSERHSTALNSKATPLSFSSSGAAGYYSHWHSYHRAGIFRKSSSDFTSFSTNGKEGHFAFIPGSGDVRKTVVRCHEKQLHHQVKPHLSACTCYW